jgi:hypothetical protein
MCDKNTKISNSKSKNLNIDNKKIPTDRKIPIKKKDSIIYEYAFRISPPIKDINIQLTA